MISARIKYAALMKQNDFSTKLVKATTSERGEKLDKAYKMLKRGVPPMQILVQLAEIIGEPLHNDLVEKMEEKIGNFLFF